MERDMLTLDDPDRSLQGDDGVSRVEGENGASFAAEDEPNALMRRKTTRDLVRNLSRMMPGMQTSLRTMSVLRTMSKRMKDFLRA